MDTWVTSEPFRSIMLVRKKTTWYSIKDGNWSDPSIWMSNKFDHKAIFSPQIGDDVVINHNVTLDNNNVTSENTVVNQYTVYNLFINGKLIFGVNSFFAVTNNINCIGTLDMSANNSHIYLQGQTNYINNLTNHATNSTVHYTGKLTQAIIPVTYCILDIVGKLPNAPTNTTVHYTYQTADITCYNWTFNGSQASTFGYTTGTLTVFNITHFVNGYNITVNNNFTFLASGGITNSINTGSFLVKGDMTVSTSSCLFNFPANYQIEVRSGIGNQAGQSGWNTQNALTIRYTTNNQTIACGANTWTTNSTNQFNHLIDGITVTVTNTGGTPNHTINTSGWIDGTNGSSILINKGAIAYNNTQIPFTTAGSMDCSTFSNYFGYISSSAQNIYSTNYYNLYINGLGAKKLLQNTTCQNFYIGQDLAAGFGSGTVSTLDTNGFNFTTNATLTVMIGASAANVIISNNNIVIKGGIVLGLTSALSVTGTAVLEVQGGGVSTNTTSTAFNVFISTAVKFTTANQNISSTGSPIRFDGTVLIDTGITVTTANSTGGYVQFNNTLNGVSGTATLLNNSTDTRYTVATQPMVTGVLDCSTTVGNLFNYNLNGNQDLTAGTYKNLTLSIGGAKKLLGNISVINTYTLSAPATLNSNGFALTNP